MPSGMFQMVGEMGWQLSHGERSRLFIARALLQETDGVVFDASRLSGTLHFSEPKSISAKYDYEGRKQNMKFKSHAKACGGSN
jgi:ABC-type transport system involved in Fe-S cluster assembly fused permease/ATPase subunit